MTNKEAIIILKEHYGKRNWCEKTRAEEALQMAIEALEKQTPKSITKEDCCPTCGASAIKEIVNPDGWCSLSELKDKYETAPKDEVLERLERGEGLPYYFHNEDK